MSPHSIIFLPLGLLAIDKLFEKFSRLFFLVLTISVSFSLFAGYFPKFDSFSTNPHGSLIVHESGTTTAYALLRSQERGVMFIGPGEKVYEGQVVGQNAKTEDIIVNVCKQKQLTNFRAKTDAVTDDLIPPRVLSLEQALEYIGDDELVEITPKSIRLRKRTLRNALR